MPVWHFKSRCLAITNCGHISSQGQQVITSCDEFPVEYSFAITNCDVKDERRRTECSGKAFRWLCVNGFSRVCP